jgi:hypothetical protein
MVGIARELVICNFAFTASTKSEQLRDRRRFDTLFCCLFVKLLLVSKGVTLRETLMKVECALSRSSSGAYFADQTFN